MKTRCPVVKTAARRAEMGFATLGLAALLTTTADAKPKGHEVSLELGSFGAYDPNFDLFSESDAVGTYGARVGYGITKSLTILGSWHHGSDGVSVDYNGYSDEEDSFEDDIYDEELFRTAFISDQFMLGPKLAWRIRPWIAPYATLQGVGILGRARIDDDFDHDDNPNQIRYTGFAPGGYVAGGVDIKPLKIGKDGLRLATHLELGYGITSDMTFKQEGGTDAELGSGAVAEVGTVNFRGFTMRWGVGVRF
jgi:hypothetical protein